MNKFWTFIIGTVVGIVLTLGIEFVAALAVASSQDSKFNMFDKPGEVVSSSSFKVIQALDANSALVYGEENGILSNYYGSTIYCLTVSDEHAGLYDDQTIEVPKGYEARILGTYRYETTQKIAKTVPVIAIIEKGKQ